MFEDFANAHLQLNDFGVGPTSEIGTSRQMRFPYLWLTHRTASAINTTNRTQIPDIILTFIIVDQHNIQTNYEDINGINSNNQQEILSDTFQIAQDLVNYIQTQMGQFGVQLVGDAITIEPVFDETQDAVTGWVMDVTLRLIHSNCVTPMGDITFTVPGTSNISLRYLTCETLNNCDTFNEAIQNLQDQIDNIVIGEICDVLEDCEVIQEIQQNITTLSGYTSSDTIGKIVTYIDDVDYSNNDYLLCDGSIFSPIDFPELASFVGTRWFNSPLQGMSVTSGSNVDENNAVVVGNSGSIYKTTDGWSTVTYLNTEAGAGTINLASVSMIDINNFVVVGDSGYIRKTTDGGLTFTDLNTAAGAGTTHLNSVSMFDTNNFVVVGDNGYIRKTTDGGLTFTNLNTEAGAGTTNLNSVSMVDTNNFVVVGNSGYIRKTTDGGLTFTNLTSAAGAGTTNLNYVYMVDVNNFVVVGNSGYIRKTTDGGLTFTNLNTVVGVGSSTLRSVYMLDSNNFVVVGDSGRMAFTTDGGLTFTNLTGLTGITNMFYGYSNNMINFIVGGSNAIRNVSDDYWLPNITSGLVTPGYTLNYFIKAK
jgi:photosystem II stability/assembly factor-like uncharacterized protein